MIIAHFIGGPKDGTTTKLHELMSQVKFAIISPDWRHADNELIYFLHGSYDGVAFYAS